MYFNEANNTNIDDEFKGQKKSITKHEKGSKKRFRFNQDTLLMCFYGFLLIVGVILIIISVK